MNANFREVITYPYIWSVIKLHQQEVTTTVYVIRNGLFFNVKTQYDAVLFRFAGYWYYTDNSFVVIIVHKSHGKMMIDDSVKELFAKNSWK